MKLANMLFALAAALMAAFPPWTTEIRWRDEAGGSLGKWRPDSVSFDGYHLWGYAADPSADSRSGARVVDLTGPMPQSLEPYIPPKQPKVAIRSEVATSVNYMILMTQLVLLFGLRQLVAARVRRAQRGRSSGMGSRRERSDLS